MFHDSNKTQEPVFAFIKRQLRTFSTRHSGSHSHPLSYLHSLGPATHSKREKYKVLTFTLIWKNTFSYMAEFMLHIDCMLVVSITVWLPQWVRALFWTVSCSYEMKCRYCGIHLEERPIWIPRVKYKSISFLTCCKWLWMTWLIPEKCIYKQ